MTKREREREKQPMTGGEIRISDDGGAEKGSVVRRAPAHWEHASCVCVCLQRVDMSGR